MILISVYRRAVKESFLAISHGINRDILIPIYKEARAKANTVENITAAFKVTGIFPLNSRVLSQPSKPTAKSRSESRANATCILENTPYTKHDLRQQTQLALGYIRTASEGVVCSWILRFALAVEHSFDEPDLVRTELQRLQHQIKNIHPSKKDM